MLSKPSLDKLPAELTINIFCLLPSVRDIHHLARVNKFFEHLFDCHRAFIYRGLITKSKCFRFDVQLTRILRLKEEWASRRERKRKRDPKSSGEADVRLIQHTLQGDPSSLTDTEVYGIITRWGALQPFKDICLAGEPEDSIASYSDNKYALTFKADALSFICGDANSEKGKATGSWQQSNVESRSSSISIEKSEAFHQALVYIWLKTEVLMMVKKHTNFINDRSIYDSVMSLLKDLDQDNVTKEFLLLVYIVYNFTFEFCFLQVTRLLTDAERPPIGKHPAGHNRYRFRGFSSHKRLLTPADVLELMLCPWRIYAAPTTGLSPIEAATPDLQRSVRHMQPDTWRYNESYMAMRYAYDPDVCDRDFQVMASVQHDITYRLSLEVVSKDNKNVVSWESDSSERLNKLALQEFLKRVGAPRLRYILEGWLTGKEGLDTDEDYDGKALQDQDCAGRANGITDDACRLRYRAEARLGIKMVTRPI